MLVTVIVFVVCERLNKVWKQTTVRIDNVTTALTFVGYGMVLAFLLVQSKAPFSNITSFHYHVFFFTDKSGEYVRMLYLAISAIAKKSF